MLCAALRSMAAGSELTPGPASTSMTSSRRRSGPAFGRPTRSGTRDGRASAGGSDESEDAELRTLRLTLARTNSCSTPGTSRGSNTRTCWTIRSRSSVDPHDPLLVRACRVRPGRPCHGPEPAASSTHCLTKRSRRWAAEPSSFDYLDLQDTAIPPSECPRSPRRGRRAVPRSGPPGGGESSALPGDAHGVQRGQPPDRRRAISGSRCARTAQHRPGSPSLDCHPFCGRWLPSTLPGLSSRPVTGTRRSPTCRGFGSWRRPDRSCWTRQSRLPGSVVVAET